MKLDSSNGWPFFDPERRHIRTPAGSFIPFYIIQRVGCIAALVIGAELTFGVTNWITIPVAILTLMWAGPQVDAESAQIRVTEYYRRLEEAERTKKEPDV